MFSGPGYKGRASDHFDGTCFCNGEPFRAKTLGDVLWWRLTSRKACWPNLRGLAPGASPPHRVDGTEMRVTFINHSTVLLQAAGINFLTDPVWSERVSPVTFAGPRRSKDPGIRFDDLPPIDFVLLSHNHYDHLDPATLSRLMQKFQPRIIVPLGNNLLLKLHGIAGGEELGWWQHIDAAPGVRITLTRAQHWSCRGTSDRFQTLWGGFAIETPGGLAYYSGDTGFGNFYSEVRERFGRPRLAMLPIGAYEPRWFMRDQHQNPEEAVAARNILDPVATLAVHWGTFQLSDEGMDAPVEALDAALKSAGLTRDAFWVLENGESRVVPPKRG